MEYNEEVKKAFDMAQKAHEGQLRHSGEPFFTHPLAVTDIIADLGLDNTAIIAGILHDAVEDTDLTIEDVEREFNSEIVKLVDGVTKLKNYEFMSREEQQWESLRKMFLAMASDIRVVIIKLADRLHNMRTLKYQSENKQIEKAKETLEIYAPLAHRLGISTIKWELEDLSLKFLEPDAYFEIANKIASTRSEREKQINSVIAQLEEKLIDFKIKAEIEGRPKHIYSIYKKMKDKNKVFEEVYDLIAVRIIVSTIKDCYGVLGLVHTMWKPIPLRFKDYIAVPKQNMYQSLHTTLLGEDGRPFEVQIRTYDMHRTAEYGIAAHWKYKEGDNAGMNSKLTWLKELMEWQTDMKDSKEFMETLKIDIFSDNVFVFTPKGDVKDFVNGATPLDFAYSVHSAIG
ncbi:MAG: RelA/SpoT family protein, partial [Christensenellaceae bacterium]